MDETMTTYEVLDIVCEALDENKWTYDRLDDENRVTFSVTGDDLPMRFNIIADDSSEMIIFHTFLFDFLVPEEKRLEFAVAVTAVNYSLKTGCFDFDINEGNVLFRQNQVYTGCDFSASTVHALLGATLHLVDRYNDRFFALAKGLMSYNDFIDRIGKD